MQIATKHHDADRLGDVAAATSTLIADILDDVRRSSPLLQRGRSAAEVDRLMRSGARIDAALALIALELPQWQLRRIAYDGGEWHCALSRTRELADWLDQPAEGRHEDLALAILSAIVDAQRVAAPSRAPAVPSVQSQALNALFTPVSCDNYS
jgi:hypothetical protein